jgi:peptidoglycan/xylan/chitin deacetylase (PgdA/CDA1 family)
MGMRAILTYHSIDESRSPVSMDEAAFRRQVRWLASGAVRVVGLAQLAGLADDVDAVALTFDDAFMNFGERAWPLLREHGLCATVFVVTDHVGRTNAWGGTEVPGIPTLPLLGWDQLAKLASEGVTLGAHTRTHPDLRSLSGAALEDEVAGSAERIAAATGRRPDAFAYPYGNWNAAVVASAARSYRLAVTTEYRPLGSHEDPHRMPRLDAFYFRQSGYERWGSAGFRSRVRFRGVLRRIRALADAGRTA